MQDSTTDQPDAPTDQQSPQGPAPRPGILRHGRTTGETNVDDAIGASDDPGRPG